MSEVRVSESDHIANLLAAPDPSILPPPDIPVNPLPSPTKEPLNTEPETVPATSKLFINV